MLRVRSERLLEIWQMLLVINAAVADYVDGEEAVGEVGQDLLDDEGLVDGGAHRHSVVSRYENEVGERGKTDIVVLHKI